MRVYSKNDPIWYYNNSVECKFKAVYLYDFPGYDRTQVAIRIIESVMENTIIVVKIDNIEPRVELTCECGALKTYGSMCALSFHSHYCMYSKLDI